MLTLPEQLMLIALKDEKGTVLFTASGILYFSIIGAIIMELYFAKKIDYENKTIIVMDNTPTGNPFFDDVLHIISDSGNKKDIKYWLLKINSKIKNVKERTLENLVDSKVLKEENHKVLGLFSKKTYPTINPEPEIKLRECIKNFVLNKENPDERNIALLSLTQTSNLLEDIFNQNEVKAAKERINELVKRSHQGEAIREETSRLIQSITTGIADASGTGGPI
ncbi:GPP34 family phosphoprotein [Bacteroidota bacterium]